MTGPGEGERRWTIPNVICGLRILGLAPLLWSAYQGHRQAFLWLMVALLLSDWLDGKLAILLDQKTELGSRLDSAADAAMYVAVALSFWWLEERAIRDALPWLMGVGVTWGLSALVGLVRFGRLPSYHTRGAKVSWLVVGVAAVLLLLRGGTHLVPWALGLVILTNLEAAAIGLILPSWRTGVTSIRQALRIRREV